MSVSELRPELWSFAGSLLLAILAYLFQVRPRLIWGQSHNFVLLKKAQQFQQAAQQQGQIPNLTTHTMSVIVQNFSRRGTATDVEVTINWEPQLWNVWPARRYEKYTSEDDKRFTLRFESLAPREFFQIELLGDSALPAILSVRCKECVGKQVPIRMFRVYPPAVYVALYVLLFLGTAQLIQILLKIFGLV